MDKLPEWVQEQLSEKMLVTAVTEDLIEEWLTTGRSRASEQQRERYRSQVLGFVRWLDANVVPKGQAVTVDDFTRQNIERWKAWFMNSRFPAGLDEEGEEGATMAESRDPVATSPVFQAAGRTCNRHFAAIRAFTRWLHDEQYVTETSQVDASLRTLESSPCLDELRRTLTALAELMEDVPTQAISRTTLDEWGFRALRALAPRLRQHHAHITAQLLLDAYRSLPTTTRRLEFLDGHVWPGPVPRAEKLMLYRYVASMTRSPQLREWLAWREDPRRDPEVKAVLLRSEAEAVLSHLLPDHSVVSEASFPRLLHRLARRHPDAAASALVQRVHGLGPSRRAVSLEGNRAGGGGRAVRVQAETLPKLLATSPDIRQTTMDLLPDIEVVS